MCYYWNTNPFHWNDFSSTSSWMNFKFNKMSLTVFFRHRCAIAIINFSPLDISSWSFSAFFIAAQWSSIAYKKRTYTNTTITQQINKPVPNIFRRQNENRRPHFSCCCRKTSPRCPISIWQIDWRQYRSSQKFSVFGNFQSLPNNAVLYAQFRNGLINQAGWVIGYDLYSIKFIWTIFQIVFGLPDKNYKTNERPRLQESWQIARLWLLV